MMDKPDILTIIEQYIDLKKCGQNYKALCPFHIERIPSFIVNPRKQIAHCFGCGFHGDVISFVRKLKGLSFRDTLVYLGISNDRQYKPDPKTLRKKELVRAFRQWCNNYCDELCVLYRTLQKAKEEAKTEEEIEALTGFYHQESLWLYQVEILLGYSNQKKFELYREVMRGRQG